MRPTGSIAEFSHAPRSGQTRLHSGLKLLPGCERGLSFTGNLIAALVKVRGGGLRSKSIQTKVVELLRKNGDGH